MVRGHPGPSLPKSLLEELDPTAGNAGRPGGRHGTHQKLSRKEARKQEREQKKVKKTQYYIKQHDTGAARPQPQVDARHPSAKGKGKERQVVSSVARAGASGTKRQAEREHAESSKRKKVKFVAEDEPSARLFTRENFTSSTSAKDVRLRLKKNGPTALEKLAAHTGSSSFRSDGAPPIRQARSKQEEEEDAYIAYLESKLGWSKGGSRTSKYGKGLEDDGLGDLLQGIDSLEATIFSAGPGNDAYSEGADEEMEWTDVEEEDSEGEGEDEQVEEEVFSSGEIDEKTDYDDSRSARGSAEDEVEEEEWTGLSGSLQAVQDDTASSPSQPKPTSQQPIPGARYIPPHLRNRPVGSEAEKLSEEQMKLQRQLKGLLNRMSEQNISSILDGVEEIYRNHRRNDVTSTLTALIVDGISSHSMLLDTYVVLHAVFVAALHKIVGVEFAAYFVQNVVASYEKHLTSAETHFTSESPAVDGQGTQDDTRGKEASNLLVLLSELFNFSVISHVLMYDLIRTLLSEQLNELRVELVLRIARDAGQQLRSVDPTALKDIIQIVHTKLPSDSKTMSSRTRFMVETLTSLKNNKAKKVASGAAGLAGSEAVERMKKFLSGLNKKKHVKTHEPLRVSLEDLHSAESRGKWWLVGAAWGGDPLVDRQQENAGGDLAKKMEPTENVLLKLAKEQGMNTDIRRSVFVVLMSSEDYVDACDRLSQLKLTEVQQREIVRVVLHCCGNEKFFNPYYAFVIQHLCRNAHSYKITLQFCLWDFLRDLGETNVGGAEVLKNIGDDVVGFDVKKISDTRMRNVARVYAWWLAKDCCTLAILKPVDFTTIRPPTQRFFKEFFTHLLISTQLSTPLLTSDLEEFPTTRNRGPIEEVFIKVTRVQTLAYGLIYFLGEVFCHGTGETGENDFLKWANKVALGTLRTGVDIVAGL